MPPDFATVQKELKHTETFINERIERFLDHYSPADDDYDPDSMVDDIGGAIEGLLMTFDHIRDTLPSRTEQDLDAHEEMDRATKTLIRRTKSRLIDIGCAEHCLEDWFSAYLNEAQ